MSFIFQMDANEQLSQPIASTSTSILVDYAPKPIHTKSQSPSPERGINSWLATHGSSYYPHDQPHRGSSPRRARQARPFALNVDDDDEDDSSSDSDSESEVREEDAIFLQPRRHLSRQGSGMTSPVSKPAHSVLQKKSSGSSHHYHHHFHLTAQRPALPVVDLSAASGHVELDLDVLPLDKSHWSDDESDLGYDSEELQVEDDDTNEDGLWVLHPDELDIPALVDDDEDEEGNPASTSTRSIPIPSATKDTSSRRLLPCFGVENSPPTRRKSSDGQSFWTPWMDQYLADATAVALQAAR
jgi:hypothetical protein